MANSWLIHLKAFYAKNKSKYTYAQAMKAAKATYKKTTTTKKKGTKKKRS